jgi:hypothetical protein
VDLNRETILGWFGLSKSIPSGDTKSAGHAGEAATVRREDRVSLGLLSLVAGGVGILFASVANLSVFSVPFCMVGLIMAVEE